MLNKEGTVLVPIANLDSVEDLIKLDDTLCLRRISSDEIEDLMRKSPDYLKFESALDNVNFVIEKRISPSGFEFYGYHEESENTRNIALSLQLSDVCSIAFPTAFFISKSSFYISNNSPRASPFKKLSYLSKAKIPVFIRLWKTIKYLENEKHYLEFPLLQFNRSFSEPSAEGIIMDYMTAFESIVFHGEKRAPNPYGLAIGIAIGMLIGKNEKERTKIKQVLNEAYETRNTIVHGHLRKGEIEIYGKKEIAFYSSVQEYLRRSLRKLLEE